MEVHPVVLRQNRLSAVRALADGRPRLIQPVIIGLVVGAVLTSSVASATATSSHTLRVRVHATSFTSTQTDPSGFVYKPGDQVFIGFTVLQYASPHSQIGTVGLYCVATGADGSELLCDAAFNLPGGKISLQSLFDVQKEWLNPTRHLAIIGGTGDYSHSRGEATVQRLSSGDEDITFTFD